MKNLLPHAPCPCGALNAKGKPRSYSECCAPWLEDGLPAPDALILMRSRYSAYVLERAAYLLSTWHPSQRPRELVLEAGVKWLGLAVRAYRLIDATHAEVEFVARCKPPTGAAQRVHERSRFVLESSSLDTPAHWLYVDGDMV